ncbi:MAG: TIM barrel protein [Terracidiphilus sp.]
MNRRTFTQSLAVAALSAAAPSLPAAAGAASNGAAASQAPSFPLSVMLWTVFTDLPFDQRLAKVAEAGYSNVELVGEYNAQHWSPAQFASANAARKRLGISFDATAGLANGVANPATRDAFLAELGEALKPMETLDCPAMIVLSGNVVPGLTREQQHQASIETLKRAAKLVEGRQIAGQPVRLLLECIHLEENPKYFLTSADEGIEIVRAVNHPQVQFLYDIFHEQMSYGNLIEKLDKHIDVVGLIHIADVPGRHEPGSGEINYANIYRKLAQLNYRHNVAMEFRPTGDQVAILREAKALALSAGAV